MNKKIRDTLFIFFIIIFVITTVLVSLYAAGYSIRRNWPPRFGQLIERTGMLILDSEPDSANIFLNGEKQRRSWLLDIGRDEITTPTKIKNLVPGEYTLRLEKEGYWPLEKKIKIESGQATFAEDFILFRRTTPSNIAICAPQEISFGPEKRNFLVLPSDGLVINLKTETSSTLTDKGAMPVQWSQNGTQILFSDKLINLNGGSTNFDLSPLGDSASNFFWDESSKKIYYQSGGAINCIVTDDKVASTVLSGGTYVAYTVRNGLLYTIETESDKSYLRVYDANTSLLRSSSDLPAGDYIFRQTETNLDLYDKRQQSLYALSDYAQQPIVKQIKPVSSWQWLSDKFLIWHNGFEIYSLDLESGRQDLLIRVSEELTGLAWNRSKNYLIYSSANQIQIVNLNLEIKTPISLLQADNIGSLSLDERNQIIYFYAKIGEEAGVYKLQLQ
ncbi:hypothetical protein CVU83_01445 [Candidatus Falkowbacteria bacterium HGW-Falkowbacteria-2]|uniref:PEGA domain-containing protein n=1 Tax=Candidatus Falkowbacteria bacterium HGW-Falkowbacteria-2 TaxID=2013769 RepID=A0A2N2E1J8_9BACT|nr:MAG: hypothetical protein CVU83_01445 [Candidatus Falkowbacteria bacterium HGW-Falkowbacteria-2]